MMSVRGWKGCGRVAEAMDLVERVELGRWILLMFRPSVVALRAVVGGRVRLGRVVAWTEFNEAAEVMR